MLINNKDFGLYPNFSKFILGAVPKIQHNSKIWNALLNATGTPKNTEGRSGLSWGQIQIPAILGSSIAELTAKVAVMGGMPPIIVPKELSHPDIDGEYHTATPHEIWMNTYWLKRFEEDAQAKRAMKKPKEFAFATVLHELIHYLDFTLDNNFSDCDRSDLDDNGYRFEDEAFGKRAEKWWTSPSHTGGDNGSLWGLRLPEWG